MKKAFQIIAFIVLGIGQNMADAQSIMRRFDVGGQNVGEGALGVEINSMGAVVFSTSSFVVDSAFAGPKTMSLFIEHNGTPIDTNIVFISSKSTYAGWTNTSFKRNNGRLGVAGGTVDSTGTQRPALYLFDSTGVVEQVFEYGTTGETWIGRQGKQTPDGGYVICGQTSSSGTSQDGFLLKIDSLGAEEWVQTYGQPNLNEFIVSVGLAPNGGYYLGGRKMITLQNTDQWVMLVDSLGNVVWDNAYGSQYDDLPNAHLESLVDGNCVIASGWSQHMNGLTLRSGLMKIDSMGNIDWFQLYGGNANSTLLWAVKELDLGDLIAAGQSRVPGGYNGTILRTNSLGDSLWMRHYLYSDSVWTSGQGLFQDVEPTPDGGFIAVGTALAASNDPNDPPVYGQDTWVVKVDSMGCLVPGCDTVTGIESYATNLKDVLKIAPNPASHIVRLSWQLPTSVPLGVRSQWAQLSVVNAAGGLVSTQQLDLSQNNYELDVSALAAGIYYLHLVIDGVWVTGGKLICLPK